MLPCSLLVILVCSLDGKTLIASHSLACSQTRITMYYHMVIILIACVSGLISGCTSKRHSKVCLLGYKAMAWHLLLAAVQKNAGRMLHSPMLLTHVVVTQCAQMPSTLDQCLGLDNRAVWTNVPTRWTIPTIIYVRLFGFPHATQYRNYLPLHLLRAGAWACCLRAYTVSGSLLTVVALRGCWTSAVCNVGSCHRMERYGESMTN